MTQDEVDFEAESEKSTPLARLVVGCALLAILITPAVLWSVTGNAYYALGWLLIVFVGFGG